MDPKLKELVNNVSKEKEETERELNEITNTISQLEARKKFLTEKKIYLSGALDALSEAAKLSDKEEVNG